jgi:hypothetical protein
MVLIKLVAEVLEDGDDGRGLRLSLCGISHFCISHFRV